MWTKLYSAAVLTLRISLSAYRCIISAICSFCTTELISSTDCSLYGELSECCKKWKFGTKYAAFAATGKPQIYCHNNI